MLARLRLPGGSARVMIVDDDADDVHLIRLSVQKATAALLGDVVITHAWDGLDALDKLSSCDDEDLPSIILLDLNMPRMNGRETLRRLRADHRLRALKVVVVTTSSEPDMTAFAAELGADGSHVKPDTRAAMTDLVGTILRTWIL